MKKTTRNLLAAAAITPLLSLGSLHAQTVLFEADFDAGVVESNDGGAVGAFAGGGADNGATPSADGDVTVDTSATGPDSSSALSAVLDPGNAGDPFTFFGVFIQNANGPDGTGTGLDISSAGTISLDLRLGQAGAHSDFNLRLEDVDGGQEFNNASVPLTPAPTDTAWTSYSFALTDFTGQGGQVVDPTMFGQIAIDAFNTPVGAGANYTLDLQVDNVQIVEATSFQDWTLFD